MHGTQVWTQTLDAFAIQMHTKCYLSLSCMIQVIHYNPIAKVAIQCYLSLSCVLVGPIKPCYQLIS